MAFLEDPRVTKGPVTQTVITHNATYQADDLDAYDSDCDEISTAEAVLMANLPSYGSDVLSETLMLEEESRSKMLLKQSDPMVLEKKVNIKPVNYAILNQFSEDFGIGFYHNDIKNDLRKLKGKDVVDNVAQVSNATTIAPGMYKLDPVTLAPKISSSTQKKNKVEDPSRIVKSCLNKPNCGIEPSGNANVQHSKLNTNSELIKLKRKKEWKPTGKVFAKAGYNWKPTGRTFTLVRNACLLTRITATNKVPLRVPIPLEIVAQEPVVTKVYTRRPKVVQIVLWYLDSGYSTHMTGDRFQLINFVHKFLGTVKFDNDQIAKIMGYGDYHIGNVTISRVYYMEGLGHNLFSVGQFCDSDLKVAFRKHTCFVCNLEGIYLISGSQETNLYTLSIGDMMASSLICLLSKASKTKSWLWHRRLSHLNFGAINHLDKIGLVRGASSFDARNFTHVNQK
nr:integrase, catalytic region, zinc finger, CCHC-type, peptidase aspartic, catalytic [Tanacetum cinerariifolium]